MHFFFCALVSGMPVIKDLELGLALQFMAMAMRNFGSADFPFDFRYVCCFLFLLGVSLAALCRSSPGSHSYLGFGAATPVVITSHCQVTCQVP